MATHEAGPKSAPCATPGGIYSRQSISVARGGRGAHREPPVIDLPSQVSAGGDGPICRYADVPDHLWHNDAASGRDRDSMETNG